MVTRSKLCKVLSIIVVTGSAVALLQVILSVRQWENTRSLDGFEDERLRAQTFLNTPLVPGGRKHSQTDRKATQLDLKTIYKKRREHLEYVCRAMDIQIQSYTKLANQLRRVPSLDLVYCPVDEDDTPKWTKTLQVLENKSLSKDMRKRNAKDDYSVEANEMESTLSSSLKVIYTRNPFWQLFEFYVNNFLAPKLKYFNHGKKIRKPKKTCDYDITFEDFTKYVRATPFKQVVAGVNNKCDVCSVGYDVIGKDDTAEQDTIFIENLLNSDNILSPEELKRVYAESDIKAFVKSAFEEKEQLPCFTDHAIFLRLWRQLQIWGYISTDKSFPFSSEQSKNLTFNSLLSVAMTSFEQSMPRSRSNTEEAFMLAYSPLPMNELEGLRRLYKDDFFLFGYHDRPSAIYFKQAPKVKFPYFDVIEIV